MGPQILAGAIFLLSATAAASAPPLRAQIDALEDRIGTYDDQATAGTPLVAVCNGLPYGPQRLLCARTGARFVEAWPRAHQGDLAAGRFVADSLSIGNGPAIRRRPAEGCAWSLALAALSREPQADRRRAHLACRDLDPKTMAAAKAQALQLGRQIAAFKS